MPGRRTSRCVLRDRPRSQHVQAFRGVAEDPDDINADATPHSQEPAMEEHGTNTFADDFGQPGSRWEVARPAKGKCLEESGSVQMDSTGPISTSFAAGVWYAT